MKISPDSLQNILLGGSFISAITGVEGTCKAALGSATWPSIEEWSKLNLSISGALVAARPPAAACHPNQPSYNSATCTKIQNEWKTWDFHIEDPISSASNNWNNDTCLPAPELPCSSEGYPVYVINATTAKQVSKAVDFAYRKNIRLNIKGSGHDFLGRSVAPNTLSIWTHQMKEIQVHSSFKIQGSSKFTNHFGPSITIGAGVTHGEAFAEANKHNLMIHVAGAPTVGFGGYITGGGHSVLSSKYGLAADAVIQMTVVTPDGKIRIANEWSEPDLFWALRGGGGGTFGVIIDITFKAFPSEPVSAHTLGFIPITNDSEPFWTTIAHTASLYPGLADHGLMAYSFILGASATSPPAFGVIFGGVNISSDKVSELLAPIEDYNKKTYPTEVYISHNISNYPSFYNFWTSNADMSTPVGVDLAVGSRLLDAKALNNPSLKDVLAEPFPTFFLVSGPGVHARDKNFNAVNPAWRTAYVHSSELLQLFVTNRCAN
jgi:hypothetical protein